MALVRRVMAEAGDVEALLSKAIAQQRERLEILAIISVVPLLLAALWHIWPGMEGKAEFLPLFAPAVILMVLALAMQDFVDFGPRHRSRLAAMTAIASAPLLLLSMGFADAELASSVRVGHGMMFVVGVACFWFTTEILNTTLSAVRFRGLVQMVGAASAAALLTTLERDGLALYLSILIFFLAVATSLYDTLGRDPDRQDRKVFKNRLSKLELRILQLRADGVKVDQAASLLQNAIVAGYSDPTEGMTIISHAEDNIERILAFSSDISDILDDAKRAVAAADDIAPTAKRAARLLAQGEREMELGSLRDAEMLFRKAKEHASQIINFWEQAQQGITDAKRELSGCVGVQYDPLKRAVQDAEEALEREACVEAAALVATIPEHVENLSMTEANATEAIEEAKLAMEAAKGIDDSDFMDRLVAAGEALSEGDFSLARGMADSLLREVEREADSMKEVQKAWRQRKKMTIRWQDWADAGEFDSRLDEVDKSRKAKQWSHAAKLLAGITDDLDRRAASSGEAGELLEFVRQEWRGLRVRLETARIKVDDAERTGCERVIGEAVTAHERGDIETCLHRLGDADARMESLRRRV